MDKNKQTKDVLTINFNLHRCIFEAYMECWNANRNRADQLKKHHREYFWELIRLAKSQVIKLQKKSPERVNIEYPDIVKVEVNSNMLAQRLKCTDRTIRNYNTALGDAGIIEKTFHGTRQNYDIIFNGLLVFYTYLNNPLRLPVLYEKSKVLKALLLQSKGKTFPLNKEMHRYINNKLIENGQQNHENKENKPGDSGLFQGVKSLFDLDSLLLQCYRIDLNFEEPAEQKETLAGLNTKNDALNTSPRCAAPPSNRDECEAPGKDKEAALSIFNGKGMFELLRSRDIETLKLAYSKILVDYAIANIPNWKENVYREVSGTVILYVLDNYYAHCKTVDQLRAVHKKYIASVNNASMYIRKKILSEAWNGHWTFPEKWFDVNYDNGFQKAIKYTEKQQEKKIELNLRKQRQNANKLLNGILDSYYSGESDFKACLDRLKALMPARIEQFRFCIKNNIKHIENQWTKEVYKT